MAIVPVPVCFSDYKRKSFGLEAQVHQGELPLAEFKRHWLSGSCPNFPFFLLHPFIFLLYQWKMDKLAALLPTD